MSAENFKPVDSYREAAEHLRRPFTVAAIKFRVLQGKDGRGNCAAYIDARLATERLNAVCPHLWSTRFEPVTGGLRCDLTIDGLTRSDVGWSKGTGNDMDLKALYSDALKRAAVQFGVGVSLYALPRLVVTVQTGQLKEWDKGGKTQYFLQAKGEQHLRGVYAQWLEREGAKAFGVPLDHGDVDREAEPEHVEPEAMPERTPARVQAEAEVLRHARESVSTKVLTKRAVMMMLTAEGASDTSSLEAALRTLSGEGLDQALEALLTQPVSA